MTGGRGYLALTALIFANWRAWPALFVCLLFGFLQAIANFMQGATLFGIEIPVQVFNAMPYIMTIVLLAGFIGKSTPPQGLRHSLYKGSIMQDLIDAAKAARKHAHVPYSKFYVGAAMRDEKGRVHAGANIENAAYPQGWCAECTAIGHLIMGGGTKITEVAVMGNGDALCTPCGGCRQKIREFAAAT